MFYVYKIPVTFKFTVAQQSTPRMKQVAANLCRETECVISFLWKYFTIYVLYSHNALNQIGALAA